MSSRQNPDPSPKPSPPVVIETGMASFELVRSLGQGHHGELLLTRQRYAGGLGGYTVVKRLNRVVRQEDYQRLVEEARLAGQMRHPNILAVQMLGGSAAEPLLFVEYTEGQRLGDVMRRAERAGRDFSEAFACYVTAEVAEGLHYAHTLVDDKGRHLGIVHRDVTPQGILLGREGEVKLVDFGAAWSRLEGRISTEGDSDLGNVSYSSPERANLDQLDGRSDLFSLGLVFLQLLTGRHLLDAEQRHEAELLGRQLRARGESGWGGLEELSAPRTADLLKRMRELRSEQVEAAIQGLPELPRAVLRRLLAPRREERFATGAELARVLRDHVWSKGWRYGRPELVAEVAALEGPVPGDLENTGDEARRGRGGGKERPGGGGPKGP
ncbi:putative serine/threonine protein kinase [Cystobacter fuscus DSM 2262]|uniref:Serine/threonine protein kinase n=1 Tax=Cystobacter fuscus (strain ATCC 25194 / DSM 2262 / NBRC 100088 / M29) TaxID=1242864 RepID=S9QZI7_CYSF2|nr:serine/threonine-protein kinase [Cystobacter fuscus]EPX62073.1 putative serine/threonine protein kinase [Cystobacter fuscus DSM 2262]